jgi:hypothetical protein
MAAFGVLCDGLEVNVFVIPAPVSKIKCQPNSALKCAEAVIQFGWVAEEGEPVLSPNTHAADKCFQRQGFKRSAAPCSAVRIGSGMPSDDADSIGTKAAGAVNPGGDPGDVRGVVGLVGDVCIIDEQAQQPHALRFQVEAELLKAVIGWVIDMKVAELKHCVAVVCCGRNGIFKTQDSRGWLEEQCIR